MTKGVFRGQAELETPGSASRACRSHGNGETKRIVKGAVPEYVNHSSHTPVSRNDAATHFPFPMSRSDSGIDDERLNSQISTRSGTREASPCAYGRTELPQDFSLLVNKSFKIVLEDGTSKSPELEKTKPHPQESMDKFWKNFDPEYTGKVTRILPDHLIENSPATSRSVGETAHHAVQSYEEARTKCIRDVKRIIRECRSLNKKYTDTHFDIERDLKISRRRDCLDGLIMGSNESTYPTDVKRVCEIFNSPKFFAHGASFDDIVQGNLGDCWLLAAFSILTCTEELVRKVCVVQDPDVGVYGFVFYRDGDWHQCIIDDKLYLRAPSYDESGDVVLGMYGVVQQDQEQSYNDLFQKGSKSLYFAQCRDENETWVPLLEKALAKAHGSYHALVGGQTGEAIEDLTGGVTTEIYTTNILNKDEFWYNELRKIGKDFVFSGAAAAYREWRSSGNTSVRNERRQGIVSQHAYAVLDTYEGHGKRLVKMRNPWGSTEWNGAWSDGSAEWNAEWFERLNHKFGNDGIFWISYEDMLKKYKYLDRTRIFGPDWHVAQQWTSVQVPWNTTDYQQTRFSIVVPDDTEAVIVLSQLDDRYFQGLQGKYNYTLQFRVQKDDDDEEEYIARSPRNYELVRSSNVEIKLEKGTYSVLFKVEAHKTSRQDVEEVIRNNIWRKEKLIQMGALYDLAHQKGQVSSARKTDTESGNRVQQTSTPAETKDAKKDDPNRDPWNASCVVGLRVYSKQADLGLSVECPTKQDEGISTTLDRDDIAKAALDEAQTNSEQVQAPTVELQEVTATAPADISQEDISAEPSAAAQKPDSAQSEEYTESVNDANQEQAEKNQNNTETEASASDVISIGSSIEIDDLSGDKAAIKRG